MGIVEDYIPDSDDEDTLPPSANEPPIMEQPSQQSNGGVTKGSTIPEFLELLRVPREFDDTLRSDALSELMCSLLMCRIADIRCSGL